MISDFLYALRDKSGMNQKELADKLGVSRQAIQKWESGAAVPSLDYIVALSDLFGVSIDYLCKGNYFDDPSGRVYANILPSYENMHEWECYPKTLATEYRQCLDEGLHIEPYKKLFAAVSNLPNDEYKDRLSDTLFDLTRHLPLRKGYPYFEPDELDEIRNNLDGYSPQLSVKSNSDILDRVTGGWYGRICGCFLGKPIEGIRYGELNTLLNLSDNFPLSRYIDAEDVPNSIKSKLSFPILSRLYPRDFGKMPADDDTNYILIAYEVLKKYGRDFTSDNVAEVWLNCQTKNAFCTAERVAYKNLVNGFPPPLSARYKNPFREWIGAQIRGDFFGYINPCDPRSAAEMAFRDGSISHVKNGIYGEMWVAAMIAASFGTDDIKQIIRCGLSQIPQKSRLYEAVCRIIDKYEKGVTADDCFNDIRKRWNESDGYDWCHTISNAEIVAAALLYGGNDYTRSITLAVSQAFDTDCNGATVGSVMGTVLGYNAIPAQWTSRVCDTLESTLFGYTTVSIKDMAQKTLAFIPAIK